MHNECHDLNRKLHSITKGNPSAVFQCNEFEVKMTLALPRDVGALRSDAEEFATFKLLVKSSPGMMHKLAYFWMKQFTDVLVHSQSYISLRKPNHTETFC